MNNENNKLASLLHDKYLHCGEILPHSDVARFVRDFEFEHGLELSAAAILDTVRAAGDRFIDSMLENEEDETNWPKWEALRPSAVRKAQIEKILA